jgi:glycosyltransferase involved in cell wall biosynthesis
MVSEHANPLAAIGGVDAGGQNVHVAALATELGRRGVDVVVHTRREAEGDPRRVRLAHRVVVDHVPAGPPRPVPKDELLPHMERFAEELARSWRRDRPDVVHAHFWMSGRAALAAAGDLDIPVLQTFHALGSVKRRWQGAADTSPACRVDEERAIIEEADHIVATCTDEVFELARLGADPRRVTVVPCGVDLDVFRPDGPSGARRPGVARLAVVGRLVERKGIDDIIRALPLVPGAELVVAGGPDACSLAADPEAIRLADLARRLGVYGRVRLVGRLGRRQVAALLRSADVAVTVPWYEPFGMVPLEAMACGVPVVAASVGGIVDSVVDGSTGLLVPPREPELLARAVRQLLADPQRLAELGAAGVHRARSRYGWRTVADATLRTYAAVRSSGPAVRTGALA